MTQQTPKMTDTSGPPSLSQGFSDQWVQWVIEHGLPELPAKLQPGEAIPIAYWPGRMRAIGFAQCHHDFSDDGQYIGVCYDINLVVAERMGNSWQVANTEGGTSWEWPSPRLPEIQGWSRLINFLREGVNWSAVIGLCRIDKYLIEVEYGNVVESNVSESHGEGFVAAVPVVGDWTIRLKLPTGHCFATHSISEWGWDG